MTLIRTPRLWLRPLVLSDADALDALNRAPQVLRYLAHEPPVLDELRARLAAAIGRARPGLERCAVTDLDGAFVGWCGVEVSDHGSMDPLEVELGYRLRPEFWGRGLASEASRALIERAFLVGGAETVFARAMTVNTGSRGVMRRCGLTHVTTYHKAYEHPLSGTEEGEVRYELTRDDWAADRVDPRAALRAALTAAMRRRDRDAVSALRLASAAVANAEAVPQSVTGPTQARSEHVAGAVVGLGAGDAERVWLSDALVTALIAAEREDATPAGRAARDGVLAEVSPA